jgi:hypothetical protein
MPEDAVSILRQTPLTVRRGPFALCAWPRGHALPPLFLTVRDDRETTALVPEVDLAELDRPKRLQRGFAVVTLDLPMDWDVVGVLARVSAALAEAGIPLGAAAAFSRDHLLVPAARLDEALAALAFVCGAVREE